ncbi:MAG: endonuclease/exonuclease/phosphatase family protein [Hyphomicrobiales bacterium]
MHCALLPTPIGLNAAIRSPYRQAPKASLAAEFSIGEDVVTFSVLTLNLWNINEPLEPRYRALEKGLKALRPDIVCLQEVFRDPKSARNQSELVAEMCGLPNVVERNGLATISRYRIVRSRSTRLPEFPGDAPRQALLVELSIEKRPVVVANTHLAYPPEMVRERTVQAGAVMAAIKRYRPTGRKIAKLLCGDFNDVGESPAVRTVLNSGENFRDAYAECNPGSPGITYSCKENRYVDPVWTVDARIDYIFASPELTSKACAVVFDGRNKLDLVSDHYGVFCALTFREGRRVSRQRKIGRGTPLRTRRGKRRQS